MHAVDVNILTLCTSRLIYHLPLNINMCNTDEMCMNIQMSKYKSDYFGVYTQVFNDTKDNKMIIFNNTHTAAGENQIFNITYMSAGGNQNMASIKE